MQFPYSFWTDIHSPKQRISTNGLIAYYKFDDTSFQVSGLDSTQHNNNLRHARNVVPTSSSGIINSGILFNANDGDFGNQLALPSANLDFVLQPNTSFTFAGWINMLPLGTVSAGTTRGSIFYNLIYINDGNFSNRIAQNFLRLEFDQFLTFSVSGSTGYATVQASNTITFSGWSFVVADWNSTTQNISLQVNNSGISNVSHTLTDNINSGSIFFFGGGGEYANFGPVTALKRLTSGSNRLAGRIDEFSVWQRVLTSGERTLLYNSGSGFSYPFIT